MVNTPKPATQRPDPAHIPRRTAAQRIDEAEHLVIDLPILGTLRLPRPEQLAYYSAVGILVALEIVDWPIALLLATGYTLTHHQHSRAIQQLGEGLQDAETLPRREW